MVKGANTGLLLILTDTVSVASWNMWLVPWNLTQCSDTHVCTHRRTHVGMHAYTHTHGFIRSVEWGSICPYGFINSVEWESICLYGFIRSVEWGSICMYGFIRSVEWGSICPYGFINSVEWGSICMYGFIRSIKVPNYNATMHLFNTHVTVGWFPTLYQEETGLFWSVITYRFR
jgi:hypothetical protein